MEFSLIILLVPLFMFLFLGLAGMRFKARTAGVLGTIGMSITTLTAYVTAAIFFTQPRVEGAFPTQIPLNFEWLRFGESLHIDLGILLDPISVMMLVVITTVSLMVHLYSLGYMKGERGFERYYAFLSLFSFSMLGLVVATNIFQMYIFWELVGVSSYLLIGFYYTRPAAVAASKKAFIVTRFADLGFLLGILTLSYYTGTFSFGDLCNTANPALAAAANHTFMGYSVLAWGLGLCFIGGAGKSAMFPLHIWLPDAMEGPTPVSALIHAATMVVAGVYLVARMFPMYVAYAPQVLVGIGYVGAFTALFAAVIACVQTDIKRVLAFSTISQIGFMMVGLGVSGMGGEEGLGYVASMFHLFTHAMFKALLFLCAGAVIHAVHSNEMTAMGGLRKHLPVTHVAFFVACLSISGVPSFSGFFSKDEILTACFEFSPVMGWTMSFIAALTGFYMFRLYYNIFWGKPAPQEHTPHEAPLSMTLPLVFLAVVTCFAGFIPFGEFVSSDGQPYHISLDTTVAVTSVVIACLSIGVATLFYANGRQTIPNKLEQLFGGLHRAATHRFYIDEVYLFVTKKVIFNCISSPIAWFDRHVVDGTLNLMASATQLVSFAIRKFQSGNVQEYAFVFLLGTLIITALAVFM
ncbi:MAG: NADH-quinone oxidoreductase subunit L [Alistipes sp.]